METLNVVPISRSAAVQRAGRAGRTAPGEVYRLYSEAQLAQMEAEPQPEILRTNLANAVLQLKGMGVHDISSIDWLDPPDPIGLRRAVRQLYLLGALDASGGLTPLGTRMARLPLEPSLAKTLLSAVSAHGASRYREHSSRQCLCITLRPWCHVCLCARDSPSTDAYQQRRPCAPWPAVRTRTVEQAARSSSSAQLRHANASTDPKETMSRCCDCAWQKLTPTAAPRARLPPHLFFAPSIRSVYLPASRQSLRVQSPTCVCVRGCAGIASGSARRRTSAMGGAWQAACAGACCVQPMT